MFQRFYAHYILILVFLLLTACESDAQPIPQSLLITPTPPPTLLTVTSTPSAMPSPTSHPTLSATYLTVEAEHRRMLAESSPTPTPMPTITPTPFYVVMPAPQDSSQQIFEGRGIYQEVPRFQVTFDSTQWSVVETIVHYQQLAGCMLDLYAGSGEVQGPMQETQMILPNVTWRIRAFPAARLIAYYGVTPQLASYLFRVNYGETADEAAIAACRNAAEAVIRTFIVFP